MGSTVTIRLEMPRSVEKLLQDLVNETHSTWMTLERVASCLERIANPVITADKDSGTSSTVLETADCQSPVTAHNGLASDKPPHKDPPPVADSPTVAGGGSPLPEHIIVRSMAGVWEYWTAVCESWWSSDRAMACVFPTAADASNKSGVHGGVVVHAGHAMPPAVMGK